jgi:alkaline phosphatase D
MTDHQNFSRRSFLDMMLASGAVVAATVGLPVPPLLQPAAAGQGLYHFPQGLASADPQPGAVMLWTRVEARHGNTPMDVALTVQVSETQDFRKVVAERAVKATADRDHTVRVLVEGLKPDWTYYYRFLAADGSIGDLTGRTRTAPLRNADRAVTLAFVSCQNFEDGFYGAYRTLINQDKAAKPGQEIDFVLHLGDQIYETVGDASGDVRALPPFASGGGATRTEKVRHALTLADFRQLYRAYLSDPDYRAARARFPFVSIWDDHEFVNDYWQSIVTFKPEGLSLPSGKVAANQAWFEYIPALLTGSVGVTGVPSAARDFIPTAVNDVDARTAPVDAAGLLQEENNLKAIGSLTIYRSLRFGRHVELVLTDTRSYRSDHAVPEGLSAGFSGQSKYLVPQKLVALMDAGRTANGGQPPAMIAMGDKQVANPRKDSPPGTLFGAAQKDWLKRTLEGSDATWKLLATSVPFLPMRLDMNQLDPKASPLVLTTDSWDGFPTERQEVMRWARQAGINNLISLSGDHHQNFGGLVYEDFDADQPLPVAVELSVTGISSTPVFQGFAAYTRPESSFYPLLVAGGDRSAQPKEKRANLNVTLRYGVRAAMTVAKTGDLAKGLAEANPKQNSHLRYIDTDSNGFGLLRVDGRGATAELVTVASSKKNYGRDGAPVVRTARFAIAPWAKGAAPTLAEPIVEGEKPFGVI